MLVLTFEVSTMKWDWRQFISQNIEKLVQRFDLKPDEVEHALQEISDFGEDADDYLQELKNLHNPQTIEMLCQFALDTRYPIARQIVLQAGYAPRGLHRRAIFYYLTEQWPKYEELDPHRELLSKAYELATTEERRKIAEAGRKGGRTEIVGIVARLRGVRTLPGTSADFKKLAAAQRWPELWTAALVASPLQSARLIRQLAAADWQPIDPAERTFFQQFKQLLEGCSEVLSPETTLRPTSKFLIAASGTRSEEIKLSPNGLTVVIGKNLPERGQVLEAYRTTDGALLASFQSSEAPRKVFSHLRPTFSSDGQYLALRHTAFHGPNVDFLLEIVRLPQLQSVVKIPGFYGKSWSSGDAFTFLGPDRLAVWSPLGYPRQIVIFSLPDGAIVSRWDWPENLKAELHQLLASPNGQLLAGRDSHGGYYFWSVLDKELLHDLARPNFGQSPTMLWFVGTSDHNPLIIYGNFAQLELRNVLTGSTLATFPTPYGILPHAIATRRDGRLVAAAYPDQSVRLWRVPAGTLIRNAKRHGDQVLDVAFISEGKMVSVSKNGIVRLWISSLYELCEKPVSALSIKEWLWLERIFKLSNLTKEERAWANFAYALLGWKFRHEVEVGEVTAIQASELDIELEQEA